MADGIIGRIAAALRRTFAAQGDDDESRAAFHCGEAGGIAAATGIFGVKALKLCDDISDAYENNDWGFLRYILSELMERPDDDGEEFYARTQRGGDRLECACGGVGRCVEASGRRRRPGALFLDDWVCVGPDVPRPRPTYDPAKVISGIAGHDAGNHPELNDGVQKRVVAAIGPESDGMTIRDGIIKGHDADCRELIEWARAGIAAGVRMSDPMAFMPPDRAARHYEEQVRTMRWAQNFGFRNARARDESVAVPNSVAINYSLVSGGGAEPEDKEDDE